MNFKIYIFLFFAFFASSAFAQHTPKVNWLSWDEAIEKNKHNPGKILVHIFTDGCGPCKTMEGTTFITPNIVNLINGNFYPVKFDARNKRELNFNGRKLNYTCNSGSCYHEFAMELTSGSLSYPSVVFLDENLNTVGAIPDYKDPKQFALYVEYYAHGHSKKMTFHRFCEYKKRFNTQH
jgi:thioredoxin-related protein